MTAGRASRSSPTGRSPTSTPVCRVHNRGDSRALKLSDFVSLRQLKRSHVYDVWFRPAGVERELNVAIPSPPWHTKTFLFDRGPGRTSPSATDSCSIGSSPISTDFGALRGLGDSSMLR